MSSDIFNAEKEIVSNAIVRLYSDGELIEQLRYSQGGKYISSYKAKVNTPYQLEVEIDGYPTLYGADTIPFKVIPSKIKMIDSAGIHAFGRFYSEYHITFKDNPNKNNYYETYTYFQLDTQLLDKAAWIYNIVDPVLLNEDANNYDPKTYPFSDILLNGENYTLIVPYDKVSENDWQQYVVFNSVSYTYYLYLTTLYKHLYNQTGRSLDFMVIDAGNPINMYSNIKNGKGVFAAYQSHIIQVN